MSTGRTGYFVSEDSLLTSVSAESPPADVLVRNGGCTLSCPGTCVYKMTGCKAIYEFRIPLDSVNFSIPIDTMGTAVIGRIGDGLSIRAQDLFGKKTKPNIAFMIRDCENNFAIFRVTAVETKPPDPIMSYCFGYEILSMTMTWVLQTDGGLRFEPPAALRSHGPGTREAGQGKQRRAVLASTRPSRSNKENGGFCNFLGRRFGHGDGATPRLLVGVKNSPMGERP